MSRQPIPLFVNSLIPEQIYSFKKPKDVERLQLIQQLPPDLRGPDWRAYRHSLFTQDEPEVLYKIRPRQSPVSGISLARVVDSADSASGQEAQEGRQSRSIGGGIARRRLTSGPARSRSLHERLV